jgi:glycosyltransferase involved in cell wall biosynthesis
MLNAMACGCVVLGSDTPPVSEVIVPNENGLLCDFFDVEGIARTAAEVLKKPDDYRSLGDAAVETITRHYSLETILPQAAEFYQEVASGPRP